MITVTLASSLGTYIDFYDLFIAGFVAADVWPALFFPHGSPLISLAESVATYFLAFFVRPIGALIYGHLGDTRGRQATLVWTLVTAGIGMVGIAATPSYASIGLAAPALIILFRLLFGLGLGGEWGGAMALVAEYGAKSKWRPFWMGWIQGGAGGGRAFAGLAFVAVASMLSREAFLSYGWRVLFLLGGSILVVAVIMRYRLVESPLFVALQRKKAVEKSPAIQVLKRYWRRILLLGGAITFDQCVPSVLLLPFSVAYLVALANSRHVVGITAGLVSLAVSVASLGDVFFQVIGGVFGSIKGRRTGLLIAALVCLIAVGGYFPLVNTLDVTNIFLAMFFAMVGVGLANGCLGAFLNEYFETKYRYSGAGLSYQVSTLITAVSAGIIFPLILVNAGSVITQWPYALGLTVALILISITCLACAKETQGVALD
jgi:MFS family permease